MQGHDPQTRRGSFGIPALFTALMTGLGFGIARRPYRPREPDPAVPASTPVSEAAPAPLASPDPLPPALPLATVADVPAGAAATALPLAADPGILSLAPSPALVAAPEPVAEASAAAPSAGEAPVAGEPPLAPFAESALLAPAAERPIPTPLGRRVLDALQGKDPLRKGQIATLVGVGRGSANRIVDRLVEGGWLRCHGDGRYDLA